MNFGIELVGSTANVNNTRVGKWITDVHVSLKFIVSNKSSTDEIA